MRADLLCPYCNAGLRVRHDDGFGDDEGVKHQMQCDTCKKYFVYETYITYGYEPKKAECLNGADHEWEAAWCYPKEYTEMKCTVCGEKRQPTKDEMKIILQVPTGATHEL